MKGIGAILFLLFPPALFAAVNPADQKLMAVKRHLRLVRQIPARMR